MLYNTRKNTLQFALLRKPNIALERNEMTLCIGAGLSSIDFEYIRQYREAIKRSELSKQREVAINLFRKTVVAKILGNRLDELFERGLSLPQIKKIMIALKKLLADVYSPDLSMLKGINLNKLPPKLKKLILAIIAFKMHNWTFTLKRDSDAIKQMQELSKIQKQVKIRRCVQIYESQVLSRDMGLSRKPY